MNEKTDVHIFVWRATKKINNQFLNVKILEAISKKIRYFLSAFVSLPRVELSLHYAIPRTLSMCRKPFLIINNRKDAWTSFVSKWEWTIK